MPHWNNQRKALAVPSSRLSRLAKLGGLASSIAGNVAGEVAMQLARGQRPRLEDLLLTPANAMKVADKLAQMRGAAMKVGQLISMDAGDMLPPELAEILGRLRSEAHHMPVAAAEEGAERRLGRRLADAGSRSSTSARSPRPRSARCTGR